MEHTAERAFSMFAPCALSLLVGIGGCNVASSEADGSSAAQDAADVSDAGAGDTGVNGDAGVAGDTGPHGMSIRKTFANNLNNQAYVITPTSEGGFAVGGHTRDLPDPDYELWMLKLDSALTVEWQRTIKTNNQADYMDQNGPYDIKQTPDGGFVMTASVVPPGQNFVNHWMFKFSPSGDLEWQKAYAIGSMDASIAMTADGRFLLTGVAGGDGPMHTAVLWVAPDGEIEWQRGYRGGNIQSHQAVPSPDGGFTVLCSAEGVIGTVFHCDAQGDLAWQIGIGAYDPHMPTQLTTIVPAAGGGYLLTGDHYDTSGAVWLMKLREDGVVAWERIYDGPGGEIGFGMWSPPDGTIFIDAYASSYPAKQGGKWVLKLDGDGGIVWQRAYGGQGMSFTRAAPISREGVALVGQIAPPDGGGRMNAWAVITNPDGSVDGDCPTGLGTPTDGTSSSVSTAIHPANISTMETTILVTDTDATVTDGNLQTVDQCAP